MSQTACNTTILVGWQSNQRRPSGQPDPEAEAAGS